MSRFRLLSYDRDGDVRGGIWCDGQVHDLAALTGEPALTGVIDALASWDRSIDAIIVGLDRGDTAAIPHPRLRAPLIPGQIYCAGANYTDHIAAMAKAQGFVPPASRGNGALPWHFVKTGRSAVIGLGDAVAIPAYSKALDWEIELAAVICRQAKDVSVDEALGVVAGYTIANDLSARDAVVRSATPPASPFRFDWVSAKCFDGSCPIGPWIVPADEIGDPQTLDLRLWVNDDCRQISNTRHMIFSVAEQIAFLSSRVTLWPGDLILTGTPAGVGMESNQYLVAGDVVRLSIAGIGELVHHVA